MTVGRKQRQQVLADRAKRVDQLLANREERVAELILELADLDKVPHLPYSALAWLTRF